MSRLNARVSQRALLGAIVAGALTVSGAGAATFHRLAVSQSTGSGGATAFVQNGSSSSALQGEVGSSANTTIHIPFGVLGEYDAPGSTFGIGVAGVSTNGYGVGAESFGSSPALIGVAGGAGAAINAAVPASSHGYAFESDVDNGADGADLYANGGGTGAYVAASSAQTDGSANGIAAFNASTNFSALVAVNEQSTPAPELDDGGGIYTTAAGPGVYAESSGDPPFAGVMDCNSYVDSSGSLDGLGGQTCAGLYIVNNGTQGYPLLVYSPSSSNYPLYLDSAGNLTLTGSITQNGDAKTRLPGTDQLAYSAKQTESTIEDFGTADLRNGGVDVPLRPDFRSTINAAQPYMVFLTPHGDCRGLYVAAMTPSGFTVRESQGGRSTLAFDYRIVARPAGTIAARLPREALAAGPRPRSGAHPMTSAMLHSLAKNRRQSHLKAHNPRMHAASSLTAPGR